MKSPETVPKILVREACTDALYKSNSRSDSYESPEVKRTTRAYDFSKFENKPTELDTNVPGFNPSVGIPEKKAQQCEN